MLSLAPTLSSLGCFAPAFARSAMGRPHHDGAIMSRPHPIYGRTRSKSSSSSSSDQESEADHRSSLSLSDRSASPSPLRRGAPAMTAARFHLPTASYRPVSPTSSSSPSDERASFSESEREQRLQQSDVSVQSGSYVSCRHLPTTLLLLLSAALSEAPLVNLFDSLALGSPKHRYDSLATVHLLQPADRARISRSRGRQQHQL